MIATITFPRKFSNHDERPSLLLHNTASTVTNCGITDHRQLELAGKQKKKEHGYELGKEHEEKGVKTITVWKKTER